MAMVSLIKDFTIICLLAATGFVGDPQGTDTIEGTIVAVISAVIIVVLCCCCVLCVRKWMAQCRNARNQDTEAAHPGHRAAPPGHTDTPPAYTPHYPRYLAAPGTSDFALHSSSSCLSSIRPRSPCHFGYTEQESPEDKQSRLQQFIELKGRKAMINQNILHLKENLDLRGDLLDKLTDDKIISNTHKERIMCKQNDRDKREELIEIMRTADRAKYFDFLVVLSQNQMDIVQSLTDNEWSL